MAKAAVSRLRIAFQTQASTYRGLNTHTEILVSPLSTPSQEKQHPLSESSRGRASGHAQGRVFSTDNARSLACTI